MNEPPPLSDKNRRPLARQFALNFVVGDGSAALAGFVSSVRGIIIYRIG